MKIVEDLTYKGMFRILYDDGTLSDMVNYSRAYDAVEREKETLRRKRNETNKDRTN